MFLFGGLKEFQHATGKGEECVFLHITNYMMDSVLKMKIKRLSLLNDILLFYKRDLATWMIGMRIITLSGINFLFLSIILTYEYINTLYSIMKKME